MKHHNRAFLICSLIICHPVKSDQNSTTLSKEIDKAFTVWQHEDSAAFSRKYEKKSTNLPPRYPTSAKIQKAEGRVLVKALVTANGSVTSASVETSSGHIDLDTAALEAVRQWHFRPAQRDGHAVDAWVNVPIHFKLPEDKHLTSPHNSGNVQDGSRMAPDLPSPRPLPQQGKGLVSE